MRYSSWTGDTNYEKYEAVLPQNCLPKNVCITASRGNKSKCNKRAEKLWFMLLGKNLISTAHVDLNCGKNCEPRPPDWFFFLAISPRGLLTVRCHGESTESRKNVKTSHSAGLNKIYFTFQWKREFNNRHKLPCKECTEKVISLWNFLSVGKPFNCGKVGLLLAL